MRIFLLCLLGLTATVTLGAAKRADNQLAVPGHHASAFDACAKVCGDCQRACDSCSTHCRHLLAQGKKEHEKTLQTCLDCADHCSTAARITARRGPFADLICTACAEACTRCGKECAKFDDEHMKQCADECRRCEKACREMLKHTGHDSASGK